MSWDWQTIVAAGCVLVAAGTLLRRGVRIVAGRAAAGCGSGCNGCEAAAGSGRNGATPGFVSLEALRTPRERGT